jgi:hypothetical protein
MLADNIFHSNVGAEPQRLNGILNASDINSIDSFFPAVSSIMTPFCSHSGGMVSAE